MHHKPEISVIMSVFNSELFLKEAVDSILNQSFRDFEFIITDDCSTDTSVKLLEDYKKLDDRIILIKNSANVGLTVNLNRMINTAKGKYIARMDADDISLPDRFEKQYNFMENNSEIGVCGTNMIFFGKFNEISKLPVENNEIKAELLFRDVIMHPTVFIRKSIIDSYSMRYNESFRISQDYDLWCRMTAHTKFANLSEPLLKYRFADTNITNSTKTEYRESFLKSIYSLQLNRIGINPAAEEIEIHIQIASGKKLSKFSELDRIEIWLQKIITMNKKTNFYDHVILESIVSRYWFAVCTRATKFGIKLFRKYYHLKFINSYDPGLKYKIKFFLKCMVNYDR